MDRPVDDKISKLDVKIPAQYTGKRVIYTVWQRDPSDAKEGFYSCSNVDVMPVDMQWKASGTLEGGQVETGSTMTLRVFDKVRGGDLESHSIIVSRARKSPSSGSMCCPRRPTMRPASSAWASSAPTARSCRSRLPTATKSMA